MVAINKKTEKRKVKEGCFYCSYASVIFYFKLIKLTAVLTGNMCPEFPLEYSLSRCVLPKFAEVNKAET